ncbi:hypothetical protein HYY70_02180 [Candidatus Woesearchaeota archaeon]|nr:hypothetical protein [Candidatus Woesearchaeota archaeon]
MSDEIEELRKKIAEHEEKIKDYEEKKKKFLEWVAYGEPNPVFKRLYRRKFMEIFEGIKKRV